MTRDEIAARVGARQHGLLTRAQALEAGFSGSAIQHRRHSGRWKTVARSVYLIHGAPFTWQARVLAACLANDGVASHRSCAVLLAVRGFRPGIPEITVPKGRAHRGAEYRIHESKDLDKTEPIWIEGIPTSTPARLAVDLGAVVSFDRYQAAVDDLLGRQLLSWDDALDALLAHSKQGRNGVGALRLLLSERYGEDIAESVLERAFARGFVLRGLPEPEPQFEVFDDDGFIARVDYAYPELRIAIELDSVRFHLNAEAFEADRAKRNRLKLKGWVVLEITWQMLMSTPDVIYAQVMAAYHAATAAKSVRV